MTWIEQHTDEAKVMRWHPTVESGESVIIGVEYGYRKDSRRWIETKRSFRVTGEQVEELSLD